MANAFYDLRPESLPLGLYVGFGVGAADVRVTTFAAPARAPHAPPSQSMDLDQTIFAYQ